jgi:hypothetical protein
VKLRKRSRRGGAPAVGRTSIAGANVRQCDRFCIVIPVSNGTLNISTNVSERIGVRICTPRVDIDLGRDGGISSGLSRGLWGTITDNGR